jgi:hypothetical protein
MMTGGKDVVAVRQFVVWLRVALRGFLSRLWQFLPSEFSDERAICLSRPGSVKTPRLSWNVQSISHHTYIFSETNFRKSALHSTGINQRHPVATPKEIKKEKRGQAILGNTSNAKHGILKNILLLWSQKASFSQNKTKCQ